eukprot:6175177-Pleurochrysis_carterae.AAC.2
MQGKNGRRRSSGHGTAPHRTTYRKGSYRDRSLKRVRVHGCIASSVEKRASKRVICAHACEDPLSLRANFVKGMNSAISEEQQIRPLTGRSDLSN